MHPVDLKMDDKKNWRLELNVNERFLSERKFFGNYLISAQFLETEQV